MGRLDDMFESALDSIESALSDWAMVREDDSTVDEADIWLGWEIARRRGWI